MQQTHSSGDGGGGGAGGGTAPVSRPVEFPGAAGRTLTGTLDLPADGQVRACAIFAHCFACDGGVRAAVDVSRALAARGIAVLRVDYEPPDRDHADIDATTLASSADDLVAAATFLDAVHGTPTLLVGHSSGGAAALLAAAQLPDVRAIATIGAPADPSVTATLSQLRRPLLLLHAPLDAEVGIDSARRLFEAARHPRSFVALDGADHLLTNAVDSQYVAGLVAAWAERYLPPFPTPTVEQLIETEDVVASIGHDHFRTEIRARAHSLLADEPVALGGTDTGATPYDLLLAALGACTAITLRMYADRRQWPLDSVRVRLTHARLHAVDKQTPQDGDARADHIQRILEIAGELTDEMRARLAEIADRCPVHRTLERGAHVATTVATDAREGTGNV